MWLMVYIVINEKILISGLWIFWLKIFEISLSSRRLHGLFICIVKSTVSPKDRGQ